MVRLARVSLTTVTLVVATLPAISVLVTVTTKSPSARSLISTSLKDHLPSTIVSESLVRVVPRLSVTEIVTVWPSSIPDTVPDTLTALCSAALIIWSTSSTVIEIVAVVSLVKVILLFAGFSAASATATVAVISPSARVDKLTSPSVHAPLTTKVVAVTVRPFLSVSVSVTVCPSSTSVTVPEKLLSLASV
ncbi:hypothetical protein PSMA108079_21900 [Pseudoalteromonas mariniglutinosa]